MTALSDGTPIEQAFDSMTRQLARDGYTPHGPDGWVHRSRRLLVTIGYTGGQFRVRWCKLEGRHRGPEQATDVTTTRQIIDLFDYIDLEAQQ